MPEIDVPGHCYAMLQAIPELRDPGEHGTYFSVQGFPNNCLNPAREETYRVLETVFDEMIELFPSKIIHVGADEVPLGAWSGSPLALARLRETAGEALATAHARRLNVVTNTHGADEIEGSGAARPAGGVPEADTGFSCVTRAVSPAAGRKRRMATSSTRTRSTCSAGARRGFAPRSPARATTWSSARARSTTSTWPTARHWPEPGAGWAGWSEPGKALSLRSGRRLDRCAEAPLPRRAELHLVGADDRPRRLRPAGVPAPVGAGGDRLDAAARQSRGSASRRWPG